MKKLYITAFFTGAVLITLTIAGMRILAPFYGATLYVWSSFLYAALASISLGYFVGGKLARRLPGEGALYLIVFLAGVLVLLIPLVKVKVLLLTSPLGVRAGALMSSLLLFALPITLLTMVLPYCIRLSKGEAGEAAGRFLGIAGVGSLSAAIVIGYLPALNISHILTLSAILLMVLAAIGYVTMKKAELAVALFFILVAHNYYTFNLMPAKDPRIVHEEESAVGQIKVIEQEAKRYLLVNGEVRSCMDLSSRGSCFEYTNRIYTDVIPDVERGLLIGLGGGTLARNLQDAGLALDVIEADAGLAEVAKKYFSYSGSVTIDSGRRYIRGTQKKYDLIVIDTFSAPAFNLLSREALEDVKGKLSEKGVVVVVTPGDPRRAKLAKAVYKTLKQVFPYVYAQLPAQKDISILYASPEPFYIPHYPIEVEEDTPIITDDTAEFLYLSHRKLLREESRKLFGDKLLAE
jgi:spermidine synthase